MDLGDAMDAVEGLASWSCWQPFEEAAVVAPRSPGVYQFRLPSTHQVVYVGMAGERGGGRVPQGLYGRLAVYQRGQGAVSGFGEAALDRAVGDIDFVEAQLTDLRSHGAKRTKVWAQDAIAWLSPEIRWAECSDRREALDLETAIERLLGPHGLWNRVSEKSRSTETAQADTAGVATRLDKRELLAIRGFVIDLDLLYRVMHHHSTVIDGGRVFNGSLRDTPGVKRLLNTLFNVPVRDTIHPVNHAVRSACRDRLAELQWATKRPGRSATYDLHRELDR